MLPCTETLKKIDFLEILFHQKAKQTNHLFKNSRVYFSK